MTRRAATSSWTRAVLAALLAYVLVLQTALVSLSGAAQAAEALNATGLHCLQDSRTPPDHAPTKAHDGLCCTVSCHGSAPAGPAPVFALGERLAPVALAATVPPNSAAARLTFSLLPVGSRAPPRRG